MRRGSCPDVIHLPPTISTVLRNRSRSNEDHETEMNGRDFPAVSKPLFGANTLSTNNSLSDPALSGDHLSVPDRDSVTRTFSNPEQSHTGRHTRPKHKVSLSKQFCNFRPCDDTILEESVLQNEALATQEDQLGMMRVRRHATSTPNIGRQCETENFYVDAPTFHSLRKGSEPARAPDQGVVSHMKRYSIQINHTLENLGHRLLGERSSKDDTGKVSTGYYSGFLGVYRCYFVM